MSNDYDASGRLLTKGEVAQICRVEIRTVDETLGSEGDSKGEWDGEPADGGGHRKRPNAEHVRAGVHAGVRDP
jgi:hypothetical protein